MPQIKALRRRQRLLSAFLEALYRIDHPMHRRAAKFREERQRRDLAVVRGPRIRELSSALCDRPAFHPAVPVGGSVAAANEAEAALPEAAFSEDALPEDVLPEVAAPDAEIEAVATAVETASEVAKAQPVISGR